MAALKIGSTPVSAVYIGSTKINRVFAGSSLVWSSLAGSVTPSAVSGTGSGAGTQTVTSSPATASATGGSGSYTYAWSYVSGDVLSIGTPTSASTRFSKSLAQGATAHSVYRCTISDGTSSVTGGVTINLTNGSV